MASTSDFAISSILQTTTGKYETIASTFPDNSFASPYVYYKRVLADLTSKHGIRVTRVYYETLRALVNAFNNLYVLDGNNRLTKVHCTMGKGERSVLSKIKKANLVLPTMSIVQTISEKNEDRRHYESKLIVDTVWNEDIQRAQRVLSFAPVPVDIYYTIGVWGEYNDDMDQLASQIQLLFNPTMDVVTPLSDLTKAYLEEEEDLTTISVGDREKRILRKEFTIRVQAYIPNPKFMVTNTGKIHTFAIEKEFFRYTVDASG